MYSPSMSCVICAAEFVTLMCAALTPVGGRMRHSNVAPDAAMLHDAESALYCRENDGDSMLQSSNGNTGAMRIPFSVGSTPARRRNDSSGCECVCTFWIGQIWP